MIRGGCRARRGRMPAPGEAHGRLADRGRTWRRRSAPVRSYASDADVRADIARGTPRQRRSWRGLTTLTFARPVSAQTLAAGVEPVGAVEVGFHVSGPPAGQGDRGSVGAAGAAGHDSAPRSEVSARCGRDRSRRGVDPCGGASCWCGSLACVAARHDASAQVRRPAPGRAGTCRVTPLLETTPRRPAPDVRAALQVTLPEGFHTNSNKPRDPLLIPVRVTFGSAAGRRHRRRAGLPRSDRLRTARRRATASGVRARVRHRRAVRRREQTRAGRDRGAGALLRYQACDETMCYLPSRVLQRVDSSRSATSRARSNTHAVFGAIVLGRGEPPTIATKPYAPPVTADGAHRRLPRDAVGALDAFVEKGRPPAISASTTSSPSSRTLKTASARTGCSRAAVRSRSCCSCCSADWR